MDSRQKVQEFFGMNPLRLIIALRTKTGDNRSISFLEPAASKIGRLWGSIVHDEK